MSDDITGCKTSYGIAMCRYNGAKNSQVEMLMIKKRYTYQYFSFVFGHYKKHNVKRLQYLFNNMTFGEKIDILSMNFSTMWYRLWLCDPEKNYDSYKKNIATAEQLKNLKYYFRKKTKFETIFLRDGGKRLKRLINNSTNASTPWEMPKGGIDTNELELNCAIREFEEESGITPDKYTLLWDVMPIISSHKDDNVIYKSVYYLAYLNNTNTNWEPKVKFASAHQLAEVEQIQWISLHDINFLNLNECSKKRLIQMYKIIANAFKSKIKSYYYLTKPNHKTTRKS